MFPSKNRIVALACAVVAFPLSARSSSAQSGILAFGDHPLDVRVPDDTFVEVAAGGTSTMARRADGTVAVWGNGFSGCELTPLSDGLAYTQISAGFATAAGLRSDGSIVTACDTETPPLPPGVRYTEVAAGGYFFAALRSDGQAVAWPCFSTVCDLPELPAGLSYVHVAAGFEHVAALRSDGAVVAWGGNSFHECEIPDLPPGMTYLSVAAGVGSTVALRSDGSIVTCGMIPPAPALARGLAYTDVRLGSSGWHAFARKSDGSWISFGEPSDPTLLSIPPLPDALSYVDFTSGWVNSMAVRSDGSIVAWGSDAYGQIEIPEPRSDGFAFVEIAAGDHLTLARRSDGRVDALPTAGTEWPAQRDFVQVAAGSSHYLGLRSDGSVSAWGYDTYGQGDVPPLPPTLAYVQIAAGAYFSVARRSDGSVVAWGDDRFGQCEVPRLPAGLVYTAVEAGGDVDGTAAHTIALRSDGSAVAWGSNDAGQCDVPPLPQGLAYVQASAGGFHTLLLRSDGAIAAFGANRAGQCDVPALPAGVTYVKVSAGWRHSAAMRSDGAIVAWGRNDEGQCTVPALPPGLHYVEVSAGHGRTVARYEGCATCYAAFCLGDTGSRSVRCPCGNYGVSGRGCDNSAATGGAQLSVHGSVEPDRVVLSASGVIPNALSLFLQGRSVLEPPVLFGDGAGCIGGRLVRIGSKTAVAGSTSYPGNGDLSIHDRSAALGDPIEPGSFRYYQVLYPDPSASFCRAPSRFNASNAVMVAW